MSEENASHLDWGYPLYQDCLDDESADVQRIAEALNYDIHDVEVMIAKSNNPFPPQINDKTGADRRWSLSRVYSWFFQPAHRLTNEEREATREDRPKKTCLYRYFDKDDFLLYVGISGDLIGRVSSHQNKSRWFQDSVRMTMEWFDKKQDAEKAEICAIKKERPLYNVVHNTNLWSSYSE